MKKVLEEEGRDAKNLVAYQISMDEGSNVAKKPLTIPKPLCSQGLANVTSQNTKNNTGSRVRSASTGRDKKSELQARYWALLFGNLQRSINEIYQTVECYENLSSCQETILVLENYIRDFKALAEWFRVSWDYEVTPLPQRPQSLAWEVRKSNPNPRVRTKSASSLTASGKTSPTFSGKSSSCSTIEECKTPPQHNQEGVGQNCQNDISVKEQKSDELHEINTESKLRVDEKATKEASWNEILALEKDISSKEIEVVTTVEQQPALRIIKLNQHTQTDLEDDNLTLAEIREKIRQMQITTKNNEEEKGITKTSLNSKSFTKVENSMESHTNKVSESNKKVINSPLKYSNVVNKQSSIIKTPNFVKSNQKPARTICKSVQKLNSERVSATKNRTMVNKMRSPHVFVRSATTLGKSDNKPILRDIPIQSQSFKKNTKNIQKIDHKCAGDPTLKSVEAERKPEPKKMPNSAGSNNDGWRTVRTRRRYSFHSCRFDQPSASASMPTLTILTDKDENNKEENNKKKCPQKQSTSLTNKFQNKDNAKSIKSTAKSKPVIVKNSNLKVTPANPSNLIKTALKTSNVLKRQKSDISYTKNSSFKDKFELNDRRKKDLKNNDEMLVTENHLEDDSEGNKNDIKIQTNRDFSRTIGDLYESIARLAGCGQELDLAGLPSCDESEEREDAESDEDQQKLLEEQENLERQIRELENSEIDIDTETDENDCETITDADENAKKPITINNKKDFLYQNEEDISLETRYHSLLAEISCVEREQVLATLQAFVSRHPGRAQELHQKLSSPSRRRSLHETIKEYQEKQARAQTKRELLQKEKTLKIQQLLARVEDVKAAKQLLIEKKRLKMEVRLERAAQNRNQYLRDIIRKAHDEEEKLKEIAFIKNLEAQNKRLDFIESCKEQEGRLQDLEQERQKKVEEKAAKEAAVEKRRQELEEARKRRLEKMNETRLKREQRIGKMQEQREKQRLAIAKEKARDREERLLALQVQQQQTTEELQRKILQKQKESARRHEESIELIRQRALELTMPKVNLDENGQRIDNEDKIEDDLSSAVSDISKEHSKAFKKKIKKLKQRMAEKSESYFSQLQPLPVHMKRESQIPKLLNIITKGGGPQGMERPLGQTLRLIAKSQIFDFQCFWLLDGLGKISDVINSGMQPNSDISKRAVAMSVQLYRNACSLCPQVGRHAVLGNSVCILFDSLLQTLQVPEEKTPQQPVELSTELLLACTVAILPANPSKQPNPELMKRLADIICYTVSIGLVDVLSRRCMKIRESIESQQSTVLSLLATLGLLTKFSELCPKGPNDSTKFLWAAKSTQLFGTVSMLYSCVVPIGECIPPRTISIASATFNLFVSMADLDLGTYQEILSDEALCLKYLDVATIILKYCGPKCTDNEKNETQATIIDLIASLGFFCVNNKKNQCMLASEQYSLIFKTLSKLPQHFNIVIYPFLVTLTHDNPKATELIQKDFNLEFLEEYKNSDVGKRNRLVTILNKMPSLAKQ